MAAILFVSPAHVRVLLDRGEPRPANEIDVSEIDIDFASVARYQAKLEHAWQEYLASQDSHHCRHTRKRSNIASSEEQLRYFLVVCIKGVGYLKRTLGYSNAFSCRYSLQ